MKCSNTIDYQRVTELIEQIRTHSDRSDLWEREAIKLYIEPILRSLGWHTDNHEEIKREYQIGLGRVDFLLIGSDKLMMPLEAKRPSQYLQDHERQLLLYSFEEGMPLAVLTNAIQWWFYLVMIDVNWKQRKFCEIDLLNENDETIVTKLDKYLSRSNFNDNSIIETAKQELSNKITDPDQSHAPTRSNTRLKNNYIEYQPDKSQTLYPNPHPHGTKMRQVFEALREDWVTGNYLTDLTGQKGGWPRWIEKHYVKSQRYGDMTLLWQKAVSPSLLYLATPEEKESLLSDPNITIYPN